MANETMNIQNGVSPITIDTEVTEGSMRPVTSDGIYKAIQAGGGGGSSDVLNVTVKMLNGNVTYSHTAEEVADAYLSGKAIKLQIIVQADANSPSLAYDTLQIDSGKLEFIPITIERGLIGDIQLDYNETPPAWLFLPNVNLGVIPYCNTIYNDYVPMTSEDTAKVQYDSIKYSVIFDGSLAQLVLGAISSAGTAIGSTITDPDIISVVNNVIENVRGRLINGRPVCFQDEYGGTQLNFDICGYTTGSYGTLADIALKTTAIESGNLENVSLCLHFSYNADGEITQAQIAAYCDSHAITFT